jgi:hypothetical protein
MISHLVLHIRVFNLDSTNLFLVLVEGILEGVDLFDQTDHLREDFLFSVRENQSFTSDIFERRYSTRRQLLSTLKETLKPSVGADPCRRLYSAAAEDGSIFSTILFANPRTRCSSHSLPRLPHFPIPNGSHQIFVIDTNRHTLLPEPIHTERRTIIGLIGNERLRWNFVIREGTFWTVELEHHVLMHYKVVSCWQLYLSRK